MSPQGAVTKAAKAGSLQAGSTKPGSSKAGSAKTGSSKAGSPDGVSSGSSKVASVGDGATGITAKAGSKQSSKQNGGPVLAAQPPEAVAEKAVVKKAKKAAGVAVAVEAKAPLSAHGKDQAAAIKRKREDPPASQPPAAKPPAAKPPAAKPPAAKPPAAKSPAAKSPAAMSPADPPSDPDFVKAARFSGAKRGFVFKRGGKGVGYYKDTPPKPVRANFGGAATKKMARR